MLLSIVINTVYISVYDNKFFGRKCSKTAFFVDITDENTLIN